MERLTKIDNTIYYRIDNNEDIIKVDNIKIANQNLANRKLYEYENIEELCEKIVSQTVYEKYEYTGEIHEEDFKDYTALYNFKERRIELYYEEYPIYFELDSYGEKWSFCCEDLEEDHEEMWSIYREALENEKIN